MNCTGIREGRPAVSSSDAMVSPGSVSQNIPFLPLVALLQCLTKAMRGVTHKVTRTLKATSQWYDRSHSHSNPRSVIQATVLPRSVTHTTVSPHSVTQATVPPHSVTQAQYPHAQSHRHSTPCLVTQAQCPHARSHTTVLPLCLHQLAYICSVQFSPHLCGSGMIYFLSWNIRLLCSPESWKSKSSI